MWKELLGVLGFVAKPTAKIFWYFTNQQNLERIKGARIEVIAFVVTKTPQPSILLARSSFGGGVWMPPQEGVNIKEQIEDALKRGLETECNMKFGNDSYIRSIRFLGTLDLPTARQNERHIADNVHGTLFESVMMKRKAYWAAIVIIADPEKLDLEPNGSEIDKLEWFTFDEARRRISETNRVEKRDLLFRGINNAETALTGHMH